MKKVAIIGTAGVPGKYGGFETLAHHLVQELGEEMQLTVYCSKKIYKPEERVKAFGNARLVYLPFDANGIQSVVYDVVSMIHALFFAQTLVILGVSGGIFIPFIKLFTRKRIIVNIDGLEWRRDKWSGFAKRFLRFSEYLAVKFSHAYITDNMALKKYAAIQYKSLSYLITYGGNHVKRVKPTAHDLMDYPILEQKYAFKVCRIEPENNIHVVLEAFKNSEMPLVIVGNWNKSQYGMNLREEYAATKNIHILDPIYDQEKLDLLRGNAHVYVHGHSAGGTNPSLVEAMSLGLPIIAFHVSYNKETTNHEALYFKDAKDLTEIVNDLSDAKLSILGQKMKVYAAQNYTWRFIARKYANMIYAFDHGYAKQKIYGNLKHAAVKKNTVDHRHLQHQRLFYEKN